MISSSSYQHILGGILIAVLLYSCAVVGPDYKRPDVKTPESYWADSLAERDSMLNIGWWEIYKDPALDSLIKFALENNKDLLIATSRVEQAKAFVGYNNADYFPKLDIGAGAFKGNYGGGLFLFDNEREALVAQGQLSWEIGFWGEVRRATESAKAELLASEFARREIQISLISEVARAYFELQDYKMRYEISKRTYASRDSGHVIIKARFEKGIIPEIDVNQSQIQLSISKASVPVYDRQVTVVENRLNLLLGQNPNSIKLQGKFLDQEVNIIIPPGIPSEILDRRPDLLEAEARLHAQTAKIGVAQAQRLPSLSLTGLFGAVSPELSNFTNVTSGWNASAGIFSPLFYFGKNKRRVEIEKEKTAQALRQYEKAVINAFSEVEIALKNIETRQEELMARRDQLAAASNAEYLSFERYNKGVTSYLEVLENQRSSFDAALLHSQAQQEFLKSYILLYKALGGGWISENDAQSEATAP
ncbi:MAG: TolC family protein [Vicingaceae bacterium]